MTWMSALLEACTENLVGRSQRQDVQVLQHRREGQPEQNSLARWLLPDTCSWGGLQGQNVESCIQGPVRLCTHEGH